MAGLINDSDRNSAYKVPGIGQLPILGRLFSNNADNARKSEIVLSITPRIIRPQATPDLRNADAWSGTESSVRDRQLRIEPLAVLRATSPKTEPAAARGAAPAPAPAAPAAAPATSAPEAPTVTGDGTPPAGAGASGSDTPPGTPAATAPGAPAAPAPATPGVTPTAPPATGFPLVTPRPLPMRGTSPVPSSTNGQ
jgi:general secretion pathway protein D